MKVSNYIAHFLDSKKIKLVFLLQGGMITRIVDSIYTLGKTKIISLHHEQSASFAADAYGRIYNKPCIALATSGPGATNLITGIANCFYDSVPAIFITGQVNINEQKGQLNVRQLGFQETDIVSMVKTITKATYRLEEASDIVRVLDDAYNLSIDGRMGPVLIDIPMNLQDSIIRDEAFYDVTKIDNKYITPTCEAIKIESFLLKYENQLQKSTKPLILIGRGIHCSESKVDLIKFINKLNIPVVSSLLAIDILDYKDPLRVGMIGSYGNRWANYALSECDLLLVLGSRLDIRQTGADTKDFIKNKKIFHVDIDQSELNNRVKECEILNCNLSDFLGISNKLEYNNSNLNTWKTKIYELYEERKDTDELVGLKGINPNIFIHELSKLSYSVGAIATDVGNNQMWVAQSFEFNNKQKLLCSGGMGAMGYAIAAAIGAACSLSCPILAITGDGGLQINIQELQTIKRLNLPVKIVVLNNQSLGMIRQFQDTYFDQRYASTVWDYSNPDFVEIAKAYEIESFRIDSYKELDQGLSYLFENEDAPFLLDVNIDLMASVYPKLIFGNSLSDMYPNYTYESRI